MKIDFYEIEKLAIIFFGLVMAYAEFKQAKHFHASWTKIALGMTGVYWAVYYAYSFYRNIAKIEQLDSHQMFVRSGILITVALISAVAILNLKVIKKLQ